LDLQERQEVPRSLEQLVILEQSGQLGRQEVPRSLEQLEQLDLLGQLEQLG
jgi:hypothetical protein